MKPLIFGVQSLLKSLMLIQLKNSPLKLVVIGSISMPISNRFHGRLADNGKITSLRGYHFLMQAFLNLEGRDLDR